MTAAIRAAVQRILQETDLNAGSAYARADSLASLEQDIQTVARWALEAAGREARLRAALQDEIDRCREVATYRKGYEGDVYDGIANNLEDILAAAGGAEGEGR